jgi:DNA-binding transcriptional LysR family regulator
MDVDLESLGTLLAVIETGSLTAAARRQRLSTNAVSQRIARLESQVGAQLFTRTTRTVRPTEAGQRVAETARRVLDELAALKASVHRSDSEVRGKVRVGLAPDLARTFDWPAFQELLRDHPALDVEIVARAREVDIVAAGLDLAVWVGPLPPRALVVRRLGSIEWHLAAAPAYAEANGLPRSLRELSSHSCLRPLGIRPETAWELVDGKGDVNQVKVKGQIESDSGEVLYAALLGGMGIGLRPGKELAQAVKAGVLVRVLPKYHLRPMPVALVAPEGRLQLPRVRVIATLIADTVAKFT